PSSRCRETGGAPPCRFPYSAPSEVSNGCGAACTRGAFALRAAEFSREVAMMATTSRLQPSPVVRCCTPRPDGSRQGSRDAELVARERLHLRWTDRHPLLCHLLPHDGGLLRRPDHAARLPLPVP